MGIWRRAGFKVALSKGSRPFLGRSREVSLVGGLFGAFQGDLSGRGELFNLGRFDEEEVPETGLSQMQPGATIVASASPISRLALPGRRRGHEAPLCQPRSNVT